MIRHRALALMFALVSAPTVLGQEAPAAAPAAATTDVSAVFGERAARR